MAYRVSSACFDVDVCVTHVLVYHSSLFQVIMLFSICIPFLQLEEIPYGPVRMIYTIDLVRSMPSFLKDWLATSLLMLSKTLQIRMDSRSTKEREAHREMQILCYNLTTRWFEPIPSQDGSQFTRIPQARSTVSPTKRPRIWSSTFCSLFSRITTRL